jgi:hypothetical protein
MLILNNMKSFDNKEEQLKESEIEKEKQTLKTRWIITNEIK